MHWPPLQCNCIRDPPSSNRRELRLTNHSKNILITRLLRKSSLFVSQSDIICLSYINLGCTDSRGRRKPPKRSEFHPSEYRKDIPTVLYVTH